MVVAPAGLFARTSWLDPKNSATPMAPSPPMDCKQQPSCTNCPDGGIVTGTNATEFALGNDCACAVTARPAAAIPAMNVLFIRLALLLPSLWFILSGPGRPPSQVRRHRFDLPGNPPVRPARLRRRILDFSRSPAGPASGSPKTGSRCPRGVSIRCAARQKAP